MLSRHRGQLSWRPHARRGRQRKVINGNIRAALGVRGLVGQAVDLFAPGVKASRTAEFVEIIAETIMGDCTMLKTVPEVVSKGSKCVCWHKAGTPEIGRPGIGVWR